MGKAPAAGCDDAVTGLLRNLPAVGILLESEEIRSLTGQFPRRVVLDAAREVIEELRQRAIKERSIGEQDVTLSSLADSILRRIEINSQSTFKRAVNATGVLLHTGLGRAPLAPAAQKALHEAVLRYSTLAVDLDTGARGDRNSHIAGVLRGLTGAGSALVVNNNSAAVLLALNTLADGQEAIISRGELVEIGGMFRIPDVMRRAGVTMVEVGTTNRTHLDDYRNAITDRTALIVKVHPSNFRVEGFVKEISVSDLAPLCHEKNLPLLYDLGSGAMVDFHQWNLPPEPTVQEAVAGGADIVTFSGDKLIGGPQSGMLVGKGELIDRCKKNPLMRAIRPDKMTLSALLATLRLFQDPELLPETHPLYTMLTQPMDLLEKRAGRLAGMIERVVGEKGKVLVQKSFSVMGSGSLPARPIPSWVVALKMNDISPENVGKLLRHADNPVFTRIEDKNVMFDLRTIFDDEFDFVCKGLVYSMSI